PSGGIGYLHPAGEVVEAAAGIGMPGGVAGQLLPATDNRIDIARIELRPVAAPAGALGRDHRRAAAEETVEHDVAAGGAVEDRVGHQAHRLHGRVQRQQVSLLGLARERVGPGVLPDIAAVPAEPAELDVVAVRPLARLEDADELMLAAVERT